MKYKCLVFDHDDTTVNSTATIHYPSFLAFMNLLQPGFTYTLEEYFRKNFDPGIMALFTEELGLSDEQVHEEFVFWQNWVKERIPTAYPGIRQIMERHKAQGGLIAVVSHSVSTVIRRDWAANGLPEPDIIFGWELPPEQRKPYTYPLEQIMQTFSLAPSELLMIDDLKPGYDMASACGVDFAAVGWSNDIPEIEGFMRKFGKYYFKTVQALDEFLGGRL